MTPIEALVQIVRKVEQDPQAHLNELAMLARSGLRESGSHRLLTTERMTDHVFLVCCCGWSVSLLDSMNVSRESWRPHLEDMVWPS